MLKRRYGLAVVCYLAIPAVVMTGALVFLVIDPEMARGHAQYERDYRLLELARTAVMQATGVLALVLWIACCYLVLKSRARSLRWLAFAAAGPFGFNVIAALEDRSPTSGDLYQGFIRNLKPYWRVPFEIAVAVSFWVVAYEGMVLARDMMIRLESFRTGTPISAIVAQQAASSGMWAAGEGMEIFYVVPLMTLLWPIVFNVAGHALKLRSRVRTLKQRSRLTEV